MITPELLGYVQAELAKGRTKDAIRTDLIHGGGWTDADIEEAFTKITPSSQPVQQPNPQVPHDLPFQSLHPIQNPDSFYVQPPAQPVQPTQTAAPVQQHMAEPFVMPPMIEPIAPVMQQPAPVTTAQTPIINPAPAPAPITLVSTPMSVPVADLTAVQSTVAQKSKPYLFWGFLCAIAVVLLSLGTLGSSRTFVTKLSGVSGAQLLLSYGLPAILAFDVAMLLISMILAQLATKLCAVPSRSWHKAGFVAGMTMLMAIIFLFVAVFIPLPTLAVLVILLICVGLETIIVDETYNVRSGKALIITIIHGVLFVAVLGLVIFVLSGLSNHRIVMQSASTINNNPGILSNQ
jgi:hypothetical protein